MTVYKTKYDTREIDYRTYIFIYLVLPVACLSHQLIITYIYAYESRVLPPLTLWSNSATLLP